MAGASAWSHSRGSDPKLAQGDRRNPVEARGLQRLQRLAPVGPQGIALPRRRVDRVRRPNGGVAGQRVEPPHVEKRDEGVERRAPLLEQRPRPQREGRPQRAQRLARSPRRRGRRGAAPSRLSGSGKRLQQDACRRVEARGAGGDGTRAVQEHQSALGTGRRHVGPFGRPPGPAGEGDEEDARPGEALGIEERRVTGPALETEGAQRVPARDEDEPVADTARCGDDRRAARGGRLARGVHERRVRGAGEGLLPVVHQQHVTAAEGERREAGVPQPRSGDRLGVRLRVGCARGSRRRIAEHVIPDHDPRPLGRQPTIHHPPVQKPLAVAGVAEDHHAAPADPLAEQCQITRRQRVRGLLRLTPAEQQNTVVAAQVGACQVRVEASVLDGVSGGVPRLGGGVERDGIGELEIDQQQPLRLRLASRGHEYDGQSDRRTDGLKSKTRPTDRPTVRPSDRPSIHECPPAYGCNASRISAALCQRSATCFASALPTAAASGFGTSRRSVRRSGAG